MNDYPLQCVFMRQIEIIGEAASNLSDEIKGNYSEIEWHKITGMRNRIIHGYFEVDLDVLCVTINSSVPALKQQIEKIIKAL